MKYKATLGILIVSCLLIAVAATQDSAQQKTIPTSKVGDIVKGVNYKVDQGRSFHLVLVPTIDKKYLFFSLTTDNIYNHLNLSLSIYKQSEQVPLQRCVREQLDSCYLSRDKITVGQTLFVVVQSGDECEYQIKSYWSDLQHIEIDTEVKFMFSKNEQKQIYHLELKGKQFEQLRIIIKPETRRYAFDKVKMYGTYGTQSQPSADKYDFKSFALWEDAEGIYLSKKELKDLNLNLILYGQIETVYTLLCTLVNNTHNDLALNTKIYEYLQKQQSSLYHINFKNSQNKLQFQHYVFRVAIFTGDLILEYYSDKETTKRITNKEPFMYMGDIQYIISKQQIQKDYPNGLYIKALSKDRVSTFMMQFEGRSQTSMLELQEHIYEFMPIAKKQIAYFRVTRYSAQQSQNLQELKVIFSLLQVVGKFSVQFRKCINSEQDCVGDQFAAHTSVIKSQHRQVGTKQTFTLSLTSDFWKVQNVAEKKAIIVVVITNTAKNQSFAAIEYNVGNRPEFLREYKPIQAHIRKEELKIYKYVNSDPSIKKVRVYINKISGCFTSYSFRHIPTDDEIKAGKNKIVNNLVEVTQKLLDEPIVVVMKGQDSATFSIIVQPVHESEDYVNSITLSEDVQFKIKIGPNKYQIFEITPIDHNIFYKYKSTGAVHACTLNQKNVCSDTKPALLNMGEIKIQQFFNRSIFVKIRNPHSDKTVEVTSIFHSNKNAHCQKRQIGQLYKQIVGEGDCFSTVINSAQDFQILIVREQFGQLAYSMILCDKILSFAMKENGEQRFMISKEQILVSCKQHSQIIFYMTTSGKVTNPEAPIKPVQDKIHLKYLVQFTKGKIVLPDGVGYHGNELSTQSQLKIFTYDLLNIIDTTIVLTTLKKLYFLVKIIDAAVKESTKISSNDYHLSSPNQNYYFLDSIYLKITKQQILKSQCKNCELLIYVYSHEQVGEAVDFTIEVTQNFVHLDEGSQKKGYLVQNSKAYYSFNTKKAGTLLIQLSDNNLNCAQIYLGRNQYPDQNNNLQKSFDGQLIKQITSNTEEVYYIAVKSRQNCAYTIAASLSTGVNQIMKLQRGALGYQNLKEGEVKYFTFRHLSDKAFKIISLHKYGHVEMYLSKTTPQGVVDLMNQPKINHKSFNYHSQHKNRLVLDSASKQFCKGCYYIIAVQAIKNTQSSIFLGDEETLIPFNQNKVINDILLKKDSFTKGQFYYIAKGIIEVKVHSGKLQVQIAYKDQSFKQIFQKNPKSVFYNFTLNQAKDYYHSATAVFKALADNTVYSLRIRPAEVSQQDDNGTHFVYMDPTQASYVYLMSGQLNCLRGFLKRSDQRLFLSYSMRDKQIAGALKIVGKIQGNFTKISQDTTRNVISIAFLDVFNTPIQTAKSYELCILHPNSSMSLTAMQSQETTLLPQNIEMLVVNKQTYDIYPEGDFLLDVFECRGTSKISYGTSRAELKDNKPKVLDMLGMPDQPHAIRLDSGYTNILLGVDGQISLIRWLPIRQDLQRGLGYYLYKAGSLKYDTSFGVIQILVEPVKRADKSKATKTEIQDVRYKLYISNNEDHLKEASQCQRYLPDSVLQYKITHEQLSNNSIKFTIQKTKLLQKYKQAQNLYFTAVADLTLTTPQNVSQQYRFVYKSQQIPAQIFTPNELQSYNLSILIALLVVLIIAIIVFTWACTRIIVPMIGRLRNRMLVEDEVESSKDKKDQMKEDGLEPPPSSDRQTMQMDKPAVQTEEKMG